MRAIAKRLILGKPAAAQRNHRAPSQPEFLARRVVNRKLALNAQRTVVENRNFRCHSIHGSRRAREYNERMLRAFAIAALMAQPLPREVLLLARTKLHMSDVLTRLPNYTCLETIERSTRSSAKKRFDLVDALQIEVAVVDGKELFSWPGEREFKERDLREIAPTGAIANGSFALHARTVFMSSRPVIKYRGDEPLNGRNTERFEFEISRVSSGYHIRIGPIEGIAGQKGTFWVDRESLDLIRLDVEAVEIPGYLPLSSSTESLYYERARIGESDFLLPKTSELVMVDDKGNASRNVITFSRCKQYTGESTVSFGDVPDTASAPEIKQPIALPEGLSLELELLTPVRFGRSAIGAPVEARVRKDAKRKGEVLVPKGAMLSGNVAVLDQSELQKLMRVAIQWREIAFEGRSGLLSARLESGGSLGPLAQTRYGFPPQNAGQMLPHPDVFYVRREPFELPRGLLLYVKTAAPFRGGAKKP